MSSGKFFQPASFSFFFYFAFPLTIVGWFQTSTGVYFSSGRYTNEEIFLAAMFTAIALISVLIGYNIRIFRMGRRGRFKMKITPNRDFNEIIIVCFLAISATATICAYLYIKYGEEVLFGTRFLLSQKFSAGSKFDQAARGLTSTSARQLGLLGLWALIAAVFQFREEFRRKKILWILSLFVGAAYLVSNFPTAMPRYQIFTGFLGASFIYAYYSRHFMRYLALIILFSLYLISPIISQFNLGRELNYDLKLFPSGNYLSSGDFDGVQQLMDAIRFVDDEGLRWGSQIISGIFFFIPRTIWTSKAISTGEMLSSFWGYSFTNRSASFYTELYVDFGIIGILVSSIIIGMLLRRVDSALNARRLSLCFLISAIAFAAYLPIIFRGALLGILPGTLVAISFPIVIVSVLRLLPHTGVLHLGVARRRAIQPNAIGCTPVPAAAKPEPGLADVSSSTAKRGHIPLLADGRLMLSTGAKMKRSNPTGRPDP